jgi:hypothetical protein
MVAFRKEHGRTDGERAAMRVGAKKRPQNPEWREKHQVQTRVNGDRLRGQKRSPDAVEKAAAAMRGRPQTDPKLAKGPAHQKAVVFHLRDASNRVHDGRNLLHFVREHEHMFLPEDVRWVPLSTKKPNALTCRAYKGLGTLFLKARSIGSWKGWTRVSRSEVFYNGGEDLLDRETGGDKTRLPAPTNSVHFTGHTDPLPLKDGDRRWRIISDTEPPTPPCQTP